MHFFSGLAKNKSRYPHRRKLADACRQVRGLSGVSNGHYDQC